MRRNDQNAIFKEMSFVPVSLNNIDYKIIQIETFK